jgi:protein-tyrosine phosphatase
MAIIHWIDAPLGGRLGIMARPRAGDWLMEEIAAWKAAGVQLVISLLEMAEVVELGLKHESQLCDATGIEFVSFPIPDRGVPESLRKTAEVAGSIATHVASGRAIAIHCRAGIGRSSLIAACALVCVGFESEPAFALIASARGMSVPDTDEQRLWVKAFEAAKDLRALGRGSWLGPAARQAPSG